MEQDNARPEPQNQTATSKKNTLPLVLVAVLLLAQLGIIGYLWVQLRTANSDNARLKQDWQSLHTELNSLKAVADSKDADKPSEDSAGCDGAPAPTVAMKSNIKAALDTKNTAVFSSYATNPVTFVLAASEEGGTKTPAQAALAMEYTHSATGPWDFNLPAATLSTYGSGDYAAYFGANTYVGKAATGMVAAFDFDCDGKVNKIFIASDAALL